MYGGCTTYALIFYNTKIIIPAKRLSKNFIPHSESKVFLMMPDLKLGSTFKFHGRVFLSHTEPKNIGTILGL